MYSNFTTIVVKCFTIMKIVMIKQKNTIKDPLDFIKFIFDFYEMVYFNVIQKT